MSTSSEVRQFVKRARAEGVDIRFYDGAGHWAVYHRNHRIGTIPASPSDFRWRRNAIADIYRATGIDLKPEHRRHKTSK